MKRKKNKLTKLTPEQNSFLRKLGLWVFNDMISRNMPEKQHTVIQNKAMRQTCSERY